MRREALRVWAVGAVVVANVVTGCGVPDAERCSAQAIGAGQHLACVVPGWVDRGYDLHTPARWDGVTPVSAILLLHGAGGSRAGTNRGTCPGGDEASPDCLVSLATAAGYAVIVPDGTGQRPVRQLRSWNAGGGDHGLACLSPIPCRLGIDDLAYVDDLLAEVEAAIPLDRQRLVATGLSNGAAMAHRLACERADRIAAIVTVGGQNQHADGGGACAVGRPVLDLHGVDDPIWPYAGGLSDFVPDHGVYAAAAVTMEGWRARNGCAATFVDEPMPDRDPTDGTTAVRRRWDGCAVATEHVIIAGGGHTWPGGHQYLEVDTVGRVARDFGSEVILEFFERHGGP